MEVTLWLAFGAGVLSFLSPCTLPLYPVFLSYITGVSVSELKNEGLKQRTAWFHTFSFLFGFSIVFLVLGLSTSLIADVFIQYKDSLRMFGAILIFVFGVFLAGLWHTVHRSNFSWCDRTSRHEPESRTRLYVGVCHRVCNSIFDNGRIRWQDQVLSTQQCKSGKSRRLFDDGVRRTIIF